MNQTLSHDTLVHHNPFASRMKFLVQRQSNIFILLLLNVRLFPFGWLLTNSIYIETLLGEPTVILDCVKVILLNIIIKSEYFVFMQLYYDT